ncbi:trigger factor [Lachnotalea glycerini]|nr:trigger factor [Lachnotalea glycerini]
MRRNFKLAAILLSTAILAVGCKSSENDYSKYVTLGNYKGIEVTKQTVEVTDEDVEAQIQSVLSQNATTQEITDRDTVEEGDVANIDYEGLLDGVAFEGGTAQGQDVTIGSGTFVPGFEDQLIGAKVGDSLSINVTFPEEYQSEDLAGKDVVFNVTLNSINMSVSPELTDEFVQGISESQTVDEYRQSVLEDLTKSKEEEAKYTKQSDIWTAIKDNCEIKGYPQELVDKYKEQITTNYGSYAEQSGVELDEMMTNYFGKSVEEYAKDIAAEEMIFKMIVQDADLKVTDEEFNEKASELATNYGYESADAFIEAYGKEELEDLVLWDVMMNYLTENAVEV